MLKQLLVLPGADASQLACPTEMPKLPAISRQPDVQMMEAGKVLIINNSALSLYIYLYVSARLYVCLIFDLLAVW